jgi:hypothetical protein
LAELSQPASPRQTKVAAMIVARISVIPTGKQPQNDKLPAPVQV